MSIESINEPGRSRLVSHTPVSINEPPDLPDNVPAPVLTALSPDTAAIGDPSFTLYVTGDNFFPGSIILFGDEDEPTTLEEDGRLSTGVDMSVWHGPDVLEVRVINGEMLSNVLQFTFTEAGTTATRRARTPTADPDELEEEIEQAREDDEFAPTHPQHKRGP
jgi:hypothetical protein